MIFRIICNIIFLIVCFCFKASAETYRIEPAELTAGKSTYIKLIRTEDLVESDVTKDYIYKVGPENPSVRIFDFSGRKAIYGNKEGMGSLVLIEKSNPSFKKIVQFYIKTGTSFRIVAISPITINRVAETPVVAKVKILDPFGNPIKGQKVLWKDEDEEIELYSNENGISEYSVHSFSQRISASINKDKVLRFYIKEDTEPESLSQIKLLHSSIFFNQGLPFFGPFVSVIDPEFNSAWSPFLINIKAYTDSRCSELSSFLTPETVNLTLTQASQFYSIKYNESSNFYLGFDYRGVRTCSNVFTPKIGFPSVENKISFEEYPEEVQTNNAILITAKMHNDLNDRILTEEKTRLRVYTDSSCVKMDPSYPDLLSVEAGNTILFNGIKFRREGVYFLGIKNKLISSCSRKIIVREKNNPPVLQQVEGKSVQANNQIKFNLDGGDADSDVLLYSLEGDNSHIASVSSDGLFVFHPNHNQVGTHLFRVKVSDGRGGVDLTEFKVDVIPEVLIDRKTFREGEIGDPLFVLTVNSGIPIKKIIFGTDIVNAFTPISALVLGEKSKLVLFKELVNEIDSTDPSDEVNVEVSGSAKFSGTYDINLSLIDVNGQKFSYQIPIEVTSENRPYIKYDIYSVDNGQVKGSDPSSIIQSIKEMSRVSEGWRTPILIRFRQGEIFCEDYKVPGTYNETDETQKSCLRSKVSSDAETVFSFSEVLDGSSRIGGIAKGIRNGVIVEKYPWEYTLAHELGHNLGLWHTFESYWNPYIVHCSSSELKSCLFYNLLNPTISSDVRTYKGDFSDFLAGWTDEVSHSFGVNDDTPIDAFNHKIININNLHEPTYSNVPYQNGDSALVYTGGQNSSNQYSFVCQQTYSNQSKDWNVSCDYASGVSASRDVMINVMSYWRRNFGNSIFSAGQKKRMDRVLLDHEELTRR